MIFELYRNTARSLGFLSNTLHASDETVLSASEESRIDYFRSYGARDPELLARVSMDLFNDLIRVSRLFYEARMDEVEQVALLILCLIRSSKLRYNIAKIPLCLASSRCKLTDEGVRRLTALVATSMRNYCEENDKNFAIRLGDIATLTGEFEVTAWCSSLTVQLTTSGLELPTAVERNERYVPIQWSPFPSDHV